MPKRKWAQALILGFSLNATGTAFVRMYWTGDPGSLEPWWIVWGATLLIGLLSGFSRSMARAYNFVHVRSLKGRWKDERG